MYFTYIYRELSRRHRQALLTALGLAVGVALVIAETAYAGGVSNAQDEVLRSLCGVGADITVLQTAKLGEGGPQRFGMQPPDGSQRGKRFTRDAITASPGQQSLAASKVATVAGLDGVSTAVGSLSLRSIHVEGRFAEMSGGGAFGDSAAQPAAGATPQAAPSMAPIKVSSFSISGVDVTDLELGPPSSGEIATGRTFTDASSTSCRCRSCA